LNLIKPFQFLEKSFIEEQASSLLCFVEQERGQSLVWPLEAVLVADSLQLRVVYENFPDDEYHRQTAAFIRPMQKMISINLGLSGADGPFGESTLGHEIGHWILHVDFRAVELAMAGATIQGQIELACRPNVEREAKGIEWQAQYFSGCLLMPRYILEAKRGKRILTNSAELADMAREIGVTTANLRSRIKDLGWIQTIPTGNRLYPGPNAPWMGKA
jgi:Zn-dependent peptidase ImmA (M78 family)